MTVIMAPANVSPTASAPARASTAMTSTDGWRRRIAATVQAIEAPRPSTVPVVQVTFAGPGQPSNHAPPPASSSSVELTNSRTVSLPRRRFTPRWSHGRLLGRTGRKPSADRPDVRHQVTPKPVAKVPSGFTAAERDFR